LRLTWLYRERATRSQAGLERDARLSNVRAAFRAASVTPTQVLLIDDVRTTGATLAEAAAALSAQGHEVSTLALACALK
jgi:predicted amidophosphoribosyltransferase